MTDAYREASKYETAKRREVKRHREAIARELQNHQERLQALRQELSPAAARVIVAAEQSEPAGTAEVRSMQTPGVVRHDGTGAYTVEDENPAPDWLNAPPPPLAPGAMVEGRSRK